MLGIKIEQLTKAADNGNLDPSKLGCGVLEARAKEYQKLNNILGI